mmetsp:Transcript_22631/g.73189  ORF Transcript_22631/g.73189 Transcript_22631/m.73189 type:complete len:86 (-) Transcript_22631:2288-2545(-)|eukprot:scaffold34921_cov236-Isochrysis_galbana.AAC.12
MLGHAAMKAPKSWDWTTSSVQGSAHDALADLRCLPRLIDISPNQGFSAKPALHWPTSAWPAGMTLASLRHAVAEPTPPSPTSHAS